MARRDDTPTKSKIKKEEESEFDFYTAQLRAFHKQRDERVRVEEERFHKKALQTRRKEVEDSIRNHIRVQEEMKAARIYVDTENPEEGYKLATETVDVKGETPLEMTWTGFPKVPIYSLKSHFDRNFPELEVPLYFPARHIPDPNKFFAGLPFGLYGLRSIPRTVNKKSQPFKIGLVLDQPSSDVRRQIIEGDGRPLLSQRRIPFLHRKVVRDVPTLFVCMKELTYNMDTVENGQVSPVELEDGEWLVTLLTEDFLPVTQFKAVLPSELLGRDLNRSYYKRSEAKDRQLTAYPPYGIGTDIWIDEWVEMVCWGFAINHSNQPTPKAEAV